MIILASGSWRLARFLYWDRGPFATFAHLRHLFGVEHDEDGNPVSWPDTEIGRILRCLHCLSVYIGLIVASLYLWQATPILLVGAPLALSTWIIIIEERFSRGQS